jgi:hypothetical protein
MNPLMMLALGMGGGAPVSGPNAAVTQPFQAPSGLMSQMFYAQPQLQQRQQMWQQQIQGADQPVLSPQPSQQQQMLTLLQRFLLGRQVPQQ